MLCSLRQREGEAANRLSKNCTAVVAITGASQFSMASLSFSSASGPCSPLLCDHSLGGVSSKEL